MTDTLKVVKHELTVDIMIGDPIMMSISPEDAAPLGMEPSVLAEQYKIILSETIAKKLDLSSPRAILTILSPHYAAQRDGNIMTAPPKNLPKDYEIPAFRIPQIKSDMEPQNIQSDD